MLNPTLVSIVALDGCDDGALLALAAGAARGLEAPLGAASLESARDRDLQMPAVDLLPETTGAGVVAVIDGKTVVVGNAALFNNLGLSLMRFGSGPERLQERGQHVLFVAIDGKAAGFLGVIDSEWRQGCATCDGDVA